MQALKEVNAQLICDRLLTVDPKILYSSYLDARGRRKAEATKSLIVLYDELTVMVLPLHPGKDSLVLAAPIESDWTDIVTKAKNLIY